MSILKGSIINEISGNIVYTTIGINTWVKATYEVNINTQ